MLASVTLSKDIAQPIQKMIIIQAIRSLILCSIGLCFLSLRTALLQSGVSAFVPVVRKESPSIYSSFGPHGFHNKCRSQIFRINAENTSSLSSSEKEELLETLRSMRVKELKAELEERKISTADAFEKDELVKRLYNARLSSPSPPKSTTATPNESTTATSKQSSDPNVIRGALSSDSSATVGSIGGTLNSESVVINDADIGSYPIMTIQIPNGSGESSLRLLLDTACSGVVLAPSAGLFTKTTFDPYQHQFPPPVVGARQIPRDMLP